MNRNKTLSERVRLFFSRYGEDYLFTLPYLVLFLLFTVIPVVASMFLSLTYFNVVEAPVFAGLENYFKLFLNDALFLKSLKTTLVLAAVTGPIGYFMCLFLAWLVNEFSPKTRMILTLLFYAPSISGSAYTIWQIIYSGDSYGLLNGILLSLNIIHSPIQWLTDPTYMMPAAIVVSLWLSLGTSFLSLIAGFQNIDKRLYEAAAVDGIRNRWQELWYITLPSMKPQLMLSAVLSITGSFGMGEVITGMFGFPSTNYTLHTMVHHLQDFGNVRFEMGYASAIAVVLFAIMIASNQLVQKLLRKLGD